MLLYEISNLENLIDKIASENQGEIPEELLKELVEKQTQSITQIENLCKYIRHLELGIETCKAEEQRIEIMRKRAENRIKSIKGYLSPYVEKSKKIEAGTFTLSTRKSEYVLLDDDFKNSKYSTIQTAVKVDKNSIKKDIKDGKVIKGARIETKQNLQIK